MSIVRLRAFTGALVLSSLAASLPPHLALAPDNRFPNRWGTSYTGTIVSTALGGERTVHIFLPVSFTTTKRKYPIIFSGDGEFYYESLVVAARQLSAVGHIPECVVVAVETPERRNDMTPLAMGNANADGDARAEKFLTFLARELRPEIESRFRGSSPSVLIGHSHGGILCHYAAAKWRKDFPFIVALDAPVQLQSDWLEKNLEESIPSGGPLRLVSLEVRYGWRDQDWARLTAEAPKNWRLTRAKLPDESHETMFFGGAYAGLKSLFGDYAAAKVKERPGSEVFAYYESLATDYGVMPVPPRNLLDDALLELTYTGNAAAARRALRVMTDGYGEPDDRVRIEQDIDKAEAMLKGKESVAQLLASPFPTADQMRPYLGTWRELKTTGAPNAEVATTITFAVKDGLGAGTMVSDLGSEKLVQEVTFLRLTKDGIEFGFMNGMHPRGVIAHAVHLADGKLVGAWEFKGVYMDMPGMQRDKSLQYVRAAP